MRHSELGRVILGLSGATIVIIIAIIMLVLSVNSDNVGIISIAYAWTPTPTPSTTPTPTPTPAPCGCVSDDCSRLFIDGPPPNSFIFIDKQDTQTETWKGAIGYLLYVEDMDWIYMGDPFNDWGMNSDSLVFTYNPEVNVTQAGEYDVNLTVDDKPSTFTCRHNNVIRYFDDPSTSTINPVVVIVSDIGFSLQGYETISDTTVLQAGRSYLVNPTFNPSERIESYTWIVDNGIIQESNSYIHMTTPDNPSIHVIPQGAGTITINYRANFYISEADMHHTEYYAETYDVYQAVLGLYSDDSDYDPGSGPGHAWWNLSFIPPDDMEVSDFIPEENLRNRLGDAGFFSVHYRPFDEGEIKFGDQGHSNVSGSHEWNVSLDNIRGALTYVDTTAITPPDYNVLYTNCVDIAINVGQQAGVNTMNSSGIDTPDSFSEYLNSLNP